MIEIIAVSLFKHKNFAILRLVFDYITYYLLFCQCVM